MSKEMVDMLPPTVTTDRMRKEALEVDYIWVNERGEQAELSAGLQLKPTVSDTH
jgi:hypothetical protein